MPIKFLKYFTGLVVLSSLSFIAVNLLTVFKAGESQPSQPVLRPAAPVAPSLEVEVPSSDNPSSVEVPEIIEDEVISVRDTATSSSAPADVPILPSLPNTASSSASLDNIIPTPSTIIMSVPFTAQAPLGEWSDSRQQDGCEEASAAMAMAWVNGEGHISKEDWLARIVGLADFEQKKYGEHRDVSVDDVVSWIFNDYYGYGRVTIKTVASTSDIVAELERGRLVIIPTDGQVLKNPYFSPPGPEEHMIVIKGYDYALGEFITNDPGTRRGEGYRYSADTIFNSIRPYVTGYKLPFPKILIREMIVVEK